MYIGNQISNRSHKAHITFLLKSDQTRRCHFFILLLNIDLIICNTCHKWRLSCRKRKIPTRLFRMVTTRQLFENWMQIILLRKITLCPLSIISAIEFLRTLFSRVDWRSPASLQSRSTEGGISIIHNLCVGESGNISVHSQRCRCRS